jgi:hypothetical protein
LFLLIIVIPIASSLNIYPILYTFKDILFRHRNLKIPAYTIKPRFLLTIYML